MPATEAQKRASRKWKEKNKERLKYETPTQVRKPLTEEQRVLRNARIRKHEAKNPQRIIRQRTERTLQLFFRDCANGNIQVRSRPRVTSLLGCSPNEFFAHIREQLLAKGWDWNEWTLKWTMDHVIPVRKFVLPNQERACYHYTNLRPLEKSKNHRCYRNWVVS